MLDIRWIRENAALVQEAAVRKKLNVSVAELLEWDERRRKLLQEGEDLRRQRNEGSRKVAEAAKAEDNRLAEQLKMSLKPVNGRLDRLTEELGEAEDQFNRLMLLVPNVPSPDTPPGNDDSDNVELRRVGKLPVWDFDPIDHVELGIMHQMIDIPRGVKVAGSRSYYLKGPGLLLHRAVQQLALDLLLEAGFTPLEVPLLVRGEQMTNTGFFPTGKEQAYSVDDEEIWLAGTSEVPLIAYYGDEIVDATVPVKLAAVSTCFRNEVGSAGRDVRGLYRVHQFSKVEMVIICAPDPALSDSLHQEITGYAEKLLSLLELPYRVMAVCAGDMSQKTYKQYDIETWMPSREAYGETHSSSNLHSFQARRSNIRCRDAEGRLVFCHTLNNTAVASPRILIPLLENHQREDGSIHIPEALRKYLGGREVLVPGSC
ncbi:seryl-tRNA synthetase [Fontibacillus phaseoli]|uniref:Serine--tRNA ligase n=1 Tax=Fontibacillus phaseoli TaxID=1416533 RepID=A0A369BNN5_9BACL|nr:serine--tRNA ligase [Fontibacillus phaseoli]RCX23229.1 seryl-tRNA synthetase [Fontibacillus phaseoli]